MEDLDSFIDGTVLSEQAILERVDEYALYCKYLGYAPAINCKTISPIRKHGDPDTVGSFVIFEPTRTKTDFEYLWCDNGTGQRGNIFQMLSLMFGGISIPEVWRMIDHDMKLGFGSGQPIHHRIPAPSRPIIQAASSIKIRSRKWREKDLDYWRKYGVNQATLDRYNTTSVEMYWLYEGQKHPKVPANLCFGCRVWSRYQLYQPFAKKEDKFRNDFSPNHVMGFSQLTYNRKQIIITKANKDILMFASAFGIETIAARSENTPLPQSLLTRLESKYDEIFVWFDNDGKQSGHKYPYPNLMTPPGEPKDPTDYYDYHGPDKTGGLITKLTGIKL